MKKILENNNIKITGDLDILPLVLTGLLVGAGMFTSLSGLVAFGYAGLVAGKYVEFNGKERVVHAGIALLAYAVGTGNISWLFALFLYLFSLDLFRVKLETVRARFSPSAG